LCHGWLKCCARLLSSAINFIHSTAFLCVLLIMIVIIIITSLYSHMSMSLTLSAPTVPLFTCLRCSLLDLDLDLDRTFPGSSRIRLPSLVPITRSRLADYKQHAHTHAYRNKYIIDYEFYCSLGLRSLVNFYVSYLFLSGFSPSFSACMQCYDSEQTEFSQRQPTC